MLIYIKTLTGKTISLTCDPSDTIQNLCFMIEEKEGIPQHQQRLIWGGKDLELEKPLTHYFISNKSTLHLVLSLSGRTDSEVTANQASGEARRKTIQPGTDEFDDHESSFPVRSQENLAAFVRQSNDDDNGFGYISNPGHHHDKLEAMLSFVVWNSELRQCKGTFDCFYSIKQPSDRSWQLPEHLETQLQPYLAAITNIQSVNPISTNLMDHLMGGPLAHMTKTYMMMLQVLESFDAICKLGFATSFFSMLVEQKSKVPTVAELRPIYRTTILLFIAALEEYLCIRARDVAIDRTYRAWSDFSNETKDLKATCDLVWSKIGFRDPVAGISGGGGPFISDISATEVESRLIAAVFDAGMVSYAGSHGSDNMNAITGTSKNISFSVDNVYRTGLCFESRQLRCLRPFVGSEVWILTQTTQNPLPPTPYNQNRFHYNQMAFSSEMRQSSHKVSVLCYMEVFADIWGPVRAVTIASGHQRRKVLQYQLSVGSIRRVKSNIASSTLQVECHWVPDQALPSPSSSGIYDQSSLLGERDLLLIGYPVPTALEEDITCRQPMTDYESQLFTRLMELGPSPATWALHERSVGMSVAYNVGVNIQGTQRLIPATTLKRHILNSTQAPSQMKSHFLSQYTGVELSLCTGNARRIKLKDVFLMPSVQSLLNRSFPGWQSKPYGNAFLHSLRMDTFESDWQRSDFPREEINPLIHTILKLLDSTGVSADGRELKAAFLTENRERALCVPILKREWCKILKDSHYTASYVIASSTCLGLSVESTNIMRHATRHGFTSLETMIDISSEYLEKRHQRLRIESGHLLVECERLTSTHRTDLMILTHPELVENMARGIWNRIVRKSTSAVEVLHDDYRGGQRFRVVIRASHPRSRTQNVEGLVRESPPTEQPAQRFNIGDTTPITLQAGQPEAVTLENQQVTTIQRGQKDLPMQPVKTRRPQIINFQPRIHRQTDFGPATGLTPRTELRPQPITNLATLVPQPSLTLNPQLPQIQVILNDRFLLKAEICTGSSGTIMTKFAARLYGLDGLIDRRFAGTARGLSPVPIIGRVHYCRLQIGQQRLTWNLCILEDTEIPGPLIIGLDLLKRYQASLDMALNVLVLNGEEIPFSCTRV